MFQTELRDKQEFRISEFERFVDGIRETASKHLHTLVLERADLKARKWTSLNTNIVYADSVMTWITSQ